MVTFCFETTRPSFFFVFMGMEEKKDIWFSSISASDKKRFDRDKAYQRFLARTGNTNEAAHRRKIWRAVWQAAAAITALFIVSQVSYRQGGKQMNVEFADVNIEAPWGSQVKTSLPDGTTVWLNADSRLTCSQGFGISERKVFLNGEGYFEVAPNETLPFSVHTDELQVSVIGTKFNLRNYPDDREATVCLLEGKISVDNHIRQGENIILEPDQKIFLNKSNGNMRLTKLTAARNDAEWTRGYLLFDEELITDIAKNLERSYNVNITVHPDLANMRFYGRFVRKESTIKEILDMLSATGKIKYRINEKEIIVNPK